MQAVEDEARFQIEAAKEGEVEDLHRRLASQGRKRKEAVDRSVRAVGHDWVVKDLRVGGWRRRRFDDVVSRLRAVAHGSPPYRSSLVVDC